MTEMNGLQETLADEIAAILERLKDGGYGTGDEIDLETLRDDLDMVTIMEEE